MGRSRRQIDVSARQRGIIEELERSGKTPQELARRIRMVLGFADGLNNLEVGAATGAHPQRVSRWRKRWWEGMGRLAASEEEGATDAELRQLMVGLLTDEYRSGAPQKFSAEQVAQIIALACEDPSDSDLPVSHWTPPELAKEAQKRGIVEKISPRQVDRFLKGGRPAAPQKPVLAEREEKGGGS